MYTAPINHIQEREKKKDKWLFEAIEVENCVEIGRRRSVKLKPSTYLSSFAIFLRSKILPKT
jgi:hypothetical protein